MSISIATMGKFIPATGGTGVQIIETGGGTYGYPMWEPKKPKVIISPFKDKERRKKDIKITVFDITEVN
jgi:hypothetical protein